MKDLSKYISEKLIVNKNYNLNTDSVDKLYEIMLDNYTEKNSWGHNKKNVIIGNFFIDISNIWFKDYVSDVHKFTNWIFNDYKKAGYPVEVDDKDVIYVRRFDDYSDYSKKRVIELLNDLNLDIIKIQPDFTQAFNVCYEKGKYLIIAFTNMDDDMKYIKDVSSLVLIIIDK